MIRTTVADRVLDTSDEETEETPLPPPSEITLETDQRTKSQLDFGDIDFVIEQIENLPKTKFANDAVIYQKRGKRKRIFQLGNNENYYKVTTTSCLI